MLYDECFSTEVPFWEKAAYLVTTLEPGTSLEVGFEAAYEDVAVTAAEDPSSLFFVQDLPRRVAAVILSPRDGPACVVRGGGTSGDGDGFVALYPKLGKLFYFVGERARPTSMFACHLHSTIKCKPVSAASERRRASASHRLGSLLAAPSAQTAPATTEVTSAPLFEKLSTTYHVRVSGGDMLLCESSEGVVFLPSASVSGDVSPIRLMIMASNDATTPTRPLATLWSKGRYLVPSDVCYAVDGRSKLMFVVDPPGAESDQLFSVTASRSVPSGVFLLARHGRFLCAAAEGGMSVPRVSSMASDCAMFELEKCDSTTDGVNYSAAASLFQPQPSTDAHLKVDKVSTKPQNEPTAAVEAADELELVQVKEELERSYECLALAVLFHDIQALPQSSRRADELAKLMHHVNERIAAQGALLAQQDLI